MMEAGRSSETSVLIQATRRNVPEDTIIHSHRRENLISYIYMRCPGDWSAQSSKEMPSSGMLRRVTLVTTDVSEGRIAPSV
jgi:hypothetical protein